MANIEERIDGIERLTKLYAPERIVFLSTCILSLAALMYCAIDMIATGNMDMAFGLFGSSGGITVSAGGSLYMWNKSLSQAFAKS